MTTSMSDTRSEAFNLLDRALLQIRFETNELLRAYETRTVEQQRTVSRIYMIADAVHNLPHLLAAESSPDDSALIREATLAKETFLVEKI